MERAVCSSEAAREASCRRASEAESLLREGEHACGGVAERMLRVDGEALGKGIRDGGGDLGAPGVAGGGFAEETEKGLSEGPPSVGKGSGLRVASVALSRARRRAG